MTHLPAHPYAELFPLLDGEDFTAFVDDIRENGIRDRIVLIDRQILDGRNRYKALQHLAESGEVLGPGWGHRAGDALSPELLDPPQLWFCAFNPAMDGEPLAWVLSKNLKRRHLTTSQRGLVAGRLANMRQGERTDLEPSANLQKVSTAEAAQALSVSERTAASGKLVAQAGIEPLNAAVERRDLSLSAAEKIARLPEAEQPAALEKALPSGNRATMASRLEPDDSLDFFPTPPWATRALVEHVLLPHLMENDIEKYSVWEPACGEGHIAEVLAEYFGKVIATDIHDYGYSRREPVDFLRPDSGDIYADWIITNPPFGEKIESFMIKALARAQYGVAMFVQMRCLETLGRYENIYRDRPPTKIAFFVERVPLCKGRWNPQGDTATAYVWLVWDKYLEPQAPCWIPPGCRDALTKADDVERFTQHPVQRKDHSQAKAGARAVPKEPPGIEPPAGRVADGRTSDAGAVGLLPAPAPLFIAAIECVCCDHFEIPREASGTAREAPSTGCGTADDGRHVGTMPEQGDAKRRPSANGVADAAAPPHPLDIPEFLRRTERPASDAQVPA